MNLHKTADPLFCTFKPALLYVAVSLRHCGRDSLVGVFRFVSRQASLTRLRYATVLCGEAPALSSGLSLT